MIIDGFGGIISPIALSVLLIIYLMTVELGSSKVRKLLTPIIAVLMILFVIVFVQNIAAKW
jgi:hypothetical protein